MDSPQGSTSYTYDAANRLTSAGGQTYTWDNNGNLTSDGVRGYTYDHANRLKQVTEGSLTTQFAYNGDGVRASKTVDSATTEYAVDLAATLPVVISDTDAVYFYGLDIIAEQLAQSDRYYYVHDGLGSVRQLLDNAGQIETSYAYDPFGVPLAGGAVANPYRFTGEAWDAEVEFLYLRARYYQPATGRFITKDPLRGQIGRPGTLNRYVYVQNSPVNHADPGGLEGPGPLCPECHDKLPDYSVFEAVGWASFLVKECWFYESWWCPEELHFGPENALTRAVMRSPALFQFRAEWARLGYQLPWKWYGQSYEPRSEGWIPEDPGAAAKAFATQHLRLVLFGDPVGAILGAFDDIAVDESDLSTGMVRIEAHNRMGWASATRVPGTVKSLIQDRPRSNLGPGGTIEQWFYWDEPMPMGCWIQAYKRLFEERFEPVDAP